MFEKYDEMKMEVEIEGVKFKFNKKGFNYIGTTEIIDKNVTFYLWTYYGNTDFTKAFNCFKLLFKNFKEIYENALEEACVIYAEKVKSLTKEEIRKFLDLKFLSIDIDDNIYKIGYSSSHVPSGYPVYHKGNFETNTFETKFVYTSD